MRTNLKNAEGVILGLLVLTDLMFLALFALRGANVLKDDGFILTYDHSYAEVFQYVKFFWLVVLCIALAILRRAIVFVALASIFAILLIDDYATLHEIWGEQLAIHWNFQPKWMLQPYDFGELIVFAGYAVVIGLLLVVGWWKAKPGEIAFLYEVVGLLGLLAVFAVGVDLLHALALPELLSNSIGAVEDGGEMVVVSAIVWRALLQARPCLTTDKATCS